MKPEYRICPLTGRTVIIAPDRAARPVTLEHFSPHHRDRAEQGFCPFCAGNEWDTPGAVYEVLENHEWQLRVVPNKYPAAVGMHEVVVECREHLSDPTKLSDAQFANVFIAYRERMNALASTGSVSVFKNVGAEAGASLPHLHSQILATPFVPEALQNELDRAAGSTVFRTMTDEADRLVYRDESFAVICPYASRFAYEMWLIPLAEQSQYESITDAACLNLAMVMKRILKALDRALDAPAYNWLIHSAPRPTPGFRWHVEILPRTARAAGFEWSTGVFINTTAPEAAASQLKQII